MKEHVSSGQNGFVLPTGDVDSLVEHLRVIRARPLRGTFQPPPPRIRCVNDATALLPSDHGPQRGVKVISNLPITSARTYSG